MIDGDDQRFINRIFSYDYEEEALSKIRPNTVLILILYIFLTWTIFNN